MFYHTCFLLVVEKQWSTFSLFVSENVSTFCNSFVSNCSEQHFSRKGQRCQGSHSHGKIGGHGEPWKSLGKSDKYQKSWKTRNVTLIRVQSVVTHMVVSKMAKL